MMNPVVAEISKKALRHNLERVKELAPNSKVMAMLKANAYGHDAVEVAKTLINADAIGVARINEALTLHDAGIKTSIVLMEGCFNQAELLKAVECQFEVVVQNPLQLEQLLNLKADDSRVKVWLKLETGMHRVGVAADKVSDMVDALKACPHVDDDLTLVSHFACADEPEVEQNQTQLARFNSITNDMEVKRSAANSAAILAIPESHFDWVRPGLMIYGSSPLADKAPQACGLVPAMTMKTQVIAVNEVNPGDYVGYGATWQAQEKTRIAVIAMGYGDGYPRHAKNGTPILINGKRYPMAGRVSMDMLTVDVGMQDDVEIGDLVELWGPNLPAEEVAENAGTISYEMFCNLANRVKRQFVD